MEDDLHMFHGRQRTRFPDFVYAWFTPSIALRSAEDDSLTDGDSDTREDFLRERELALRDADECRWALYYGTKMLQKNEFCAMEARIFYQLLDEKSGDEELVFFSYCCKLLEKQNRSLLQSHCPQNTATEEVPKCKLSLNTKCAVSYFKLSKQSGANQKVKNVTKAQRNEAFLVNQSSLDRYFANYTEFEQYFRDTQTDVMEKVKSF